MKSLTIAYDESGSECLYVDGKEWGHTRETTVFATDIAEAAAGRPTTIRHFPVDRGDRDWPVYLVDLIGTEPDVVQHHCLSELVPGITVDTIGLKKQIKAMTESVLLEFMGTGIEGEVEGVINLLEAIYDYLNAPRE